MSEELNRESVKIREFFSTHKPSAGSNREGKVAEFLENYLPKKYAIGSGLVLSKDGEFSNQADVLVTDHMCNFPLFNDMREKIWLVESVFALIEVKTQFTPTTLKDSLEKCRRFKTLPRNFSSDFGRQSITDSLFIMWSFEGPSPEKIKVHIEKELKQIPIAEQPDFIIIPGSVLARAGQYYEISKIGQANSQYRATKMAETNGNLEGFLSPGFELLKLDSNSIFAWLIWFTSWLQAAGERRAELTSYTPSEMLWGEKV